MAAGVALGLAPQQPPLIVQVLLTLAVVTAMGPLLYRLAYRAETTVNWCPELGTVLANDEVKDGKSERGGFPVYQKKMLQWSMRITAYAERLLQALVRSGDEAVQRHGNPESKL